MLQCVVHENCDGLTANPNGETHGVFIPVPVSLMEKAGTYTFVLHFYDDYADTYKNHQVKAALEVNQFIPSGFSIYTCICPDKVHYPDQGDGKDCHCYQGAGMCASCPALAYYCPGQLAGQHPQCQCPNSRTCQPNICALCQKIRGKLGSYIAAAGYVRTNGYGQVEFYVRLIVRWKGQHIAERLQVKAVRPKPRTSGETQKNVTVKRWREWQDNSGQIWTIWSGIWKVTKLAGRWELWVGGVKGDKATFKIQKRDQILITAYTWIKANRNVPGAFPCNALTYSVYNHVNLPLPYELGPNQPPNQFDSTVPDTGEGSLIFYTYSSFPDCAHVGIKDGIDIIDINCALKHTDQNNLLLVDKHLQSLLIPHYAAVSNPKTLKDLIELDKE